MQRRYFIIILVSLVYLIFILDIFAAQYFLYWRFWWMDMVMHFLGGLWIALLSYYVFFLSGYFKKISERLSLFYTSLFFLLFVGISWEIFEYVTKVSVAQPNYILDTYLDLLMDMIGWLVAYFFLLRFHRKELMVAKGEKIDIIIE